MFSATFLLINFATKYDKTIEPPIDDETRHAFDDWFRDAAVAKSVEDKFKEHNLEHIDPTVQIEKDQAKESDEISEEPSKKEAMEDIADDEFDHSERLNVWRILEIIGVKRNIPN